MAQIRILIVDDHAILRAGLRVLIRGQADMNVVGEAGDATQAVQSASALDPDVIILDLSIPGGGLRALEEIRRTCPNRRALVLTMHDDQAYLRSSLAAGAAGFLVKRAADAELLTAIRTVYNGRSYIDVALAATGLTDVVNDMKAPAAQGLSGLSQREREVLEQVAYGYTNREIAARLQVSPKSVETYRARVQEKLGMKSRADLVRFALEMGIVHSDGAMAPDTRST